MIKIKKIECNQIAENCYIVSDETKECVIIDCGANSVFEEDAIKQYIAAEELTPKAYMLTHGHFDHIMGSRFICNTYSLRPIICEADAELYKDSRKQALGFGMRVDTEMPAIGRCVNDGDEVKFGNHAFKVIHTPGHTPGGLVYYCAEEAVAFTGDTLFYGSIGRTDLPGGNMFQIIQSLRTLTQLPDNTKIYPGHGPSTKLDYELASNPYLDR